jgi:hypothetical protein
MCTLWTLNDLPNNSILILDEPETHVSPKSQDALMNIIAKFCDERAIWVIITTHSPTIIRRLRRENVLLLTRHEGKAELVPNATKLDIALLLGGGVTYQCAIIVEDEAARSFLITLLQRLDPDLYRQCEILVAGSKGKITSLLNLMPKTRSWLTLIGIYDGDVREEFKKDNVKTQWPHTFLPGECSPEDLLKSLFENGNEIIASVSNELGIAAQRVIMALDHATGSDVHEYVQLLSMSLGIDLEQCRQALTRTWVDGNHETAALLVKDIRRMIDADK